MPSHDEGANVNTPITSSDGDTSQMIPSESEQVELTSKCKE